MILTRMGVLGGARMPPIGSNVIDTAGRQLIADWITNELPSWQTYDDWQNTQFVDPESPEAALDADPDGDERTNAFEYLTQTLPGDSQSAWDITSGVYGGNHQIGYIAVRGRATIVEVSTDAVTWTPWQHPSNQLTYASTSVATALSIPITGLNRQFVRLRFLAR